MKRTDWKSVGKRIGVGVLGLCVGLLLLCALGGVLVTKELVPPDLARAMVQVLALAGLFAVCWFLARSAPKQRLAVSGITCGLAAVAALLVKGLAFPDETLQPRGLPAILAAGVLAGVLASRKKMRRR